MNNRRILILVVAILLLSQSISLYAETLDLDLKTARKITLENNPGIKLAREGVNKSKLQITESRSNFFPSFNGFSSLQHAWDLQVNIVPNFIKEMMGPLTPGYDDMPNYVEMSFGLENTLVYGVSINQPLFTGGAIWNGYKMSKLGHDIAVSQLKSTEQKVLGDLTSAYYGLLFAKSLLSVTDEALTSAEQNLEQVNKFFKVGKSSRFDVLRAEVQVANYKPMVISVKNNLRLAESRLKIIMGFNTEVMFNITEKLKYEKCDLLDKSIDQITEIAYRNRPEMNIMSAQKAITKRQLSLAVSAGIPSVVFGTTYQYMGQRNKNFHFTDEDLNKAFNSSISINIPLFNGLKNSSRIQQAKIAIKESNHQEESLKNGIKLEVKSAYFKMKEAEEKVETQKKTIEQAREALRLANLMYSEGASTQLDVLNANLALNQAKMNYQQSLFEYNVALANLKKSINQL